MWFSSYLTLPSTIFVVVVRVLCFDFVFFPSYQQRLEIRLLWRIHLHDIHIYIFFGGGRGVGCQTFPFVLFSISSRPKRDWPQPPRVKNM